MAFISQLQKWEKRLSDLFPTEKALLLPLPLAAFSYHCHCHCAVGCVLKGACVLRMQDLESVVSHDREGFPTYMKEKDFAEKYILPKNSLLGKGKYASVHLVTVAPMHLLTRMEPWKQRDTRKERALGGGGKGRGRMKERARMWSGLVA